MRMWRVGVVLGLAAALSGCDTTAGPPTEITRFHAPAPIGPGSVSIVPLTGDPADLAFRTDAAALAPAMQGAGFTVVSPGAPSDMVAVLDVRRSTFPTPPHGPSFSVGFGGASFGRHGGIGGDAGVGIGPHPGTGVGTEIMIQLKRRADGTNLWEGRGRTSAELGKPEGAEPAAVSRIATALFTGFPGESGRTIVVK